VADDSENDAQTLAETCRRNLQKFAEISMRGMRSASRLRASADFCKFLQVSALANMRGTFWKGS